MFLPSALYLQGAGKERSIIKEWGSKSNNVHKIPVS